MGQFDDLIPASEPQGGGLFGDLVPNKAPTTTFDDLVPASQGSGGFVESLAGAGQAIQGLPGKLADLIGLSAQPDAPASAGQFLKNVGRSAITTAGGAIPGIQFAGALSAPQELKELQDKPALEQAKEIARPLLGQYYPSTYSKENLYQDPVGSAASAAIALAPLLGLFKGKVPGEIKAGEAKAPVGEAVVAPEIAPEAIPPKLLEDLVVKEPIPRPPVTPGFEERGFVETLRESQKTAPEVAASLAGEYKPITNADTIAAAKARIEADPVAAKDFVYEAKKPTAETFTTAQLLMEKLQKEGDFNEAIRLAEHVAEKATESGQAIQSLSIWNRLSPEGVLRYTQKIVKKANEELPKGKLVQLTPDQAKAFRQRAIDLQEMPEGPDKLIATAKLQQDIHALIPSSVAQKVATMQTFGQLLNPKTLVRNVIGNFGMKSAELGKDVLAVPLDVLVSKFTGERSRAFVNPLEDIKGFAEGARQGFKEAIAGVDTVRLANKFDLPSVPTFRSGPLKAAETALNISLRAPDRAFYQSAYNHSLAEQMKLARVAEATPEMKAQAHFDGLYSTFQDKNVATQLFTGLKKGLNLQKGFGLGDVVLKYPATPANLLMRGLDYSPYGMVKGVMELAKPLFGREFDQRAFVNSTSRGLMGSGALTGAGALLAQIGLLTESPAKDKDIRNVQKGAGLGQYQLNVSGLKRLALSGFDLNEARRKAGDTLVTYDWLQPFAMPVSLGAKFVNNKKAAESEGFVETATTSLESSVQSLAEQPLVSGVSRLFAGPGSGGESAVQGLKNVLKGVPASFVPTLLKQVNQLTDNVARETKDKNPFKEAWNLASAKTPLAKLLPARIDVFGNVQETYQGGTNTPFNVLFNPAFVSKYTPTPEAQMVIDIYEQTGEVGHAPRVVPDTIRYKGMKVELSPEQKQKMQIEVGGVTKNVFRELALSEKFNALPDMQKVDILNGALTKIFDAAKQRVIIEGVRSQPDQQSRGMYLLDLLAKNKKADKGKIQGFMKALSNNKPVSFDDLVPEGKH